MSLGGLRLVSRVTIACLLVGVACAGCSETTAGLPGLATASLQAPVGGVTAPMTRASVAPAAGGAAPSEEDQLRASRRTMASKVMAARALERVTGRKPDPGRLADAMD